MAEIIINLEESMAFGILLDASPEAEAHAGEREQKILDRINAPTPPQEPLCTDGHAGVLAPSRTGAMSYDHSRLSSKDMVVLTGTLALFATLASDKILEGFLRTQGLFPLSLTDQDFLFLATITTLTIVNCLKKPEQPYDTY